MFGQLELILIVLAYVGLLFGVAQLAERSSPKGRSRANNPIVYSLGLGVYCTTWTFYGSVGKAAKDGMLWLCIYLGPTLQKLWSSRSSSSAGSRRCSHRVCCGGRSPTWAPAPRPRRRTCCAHCP
jgi:hypothetical protein